MTEYNLLEYKMVAFGLKEEYMLFFDSLDKASEIFNRFKTHNFISNSEYNMVAFRLREEYMLFFKLHEKVSFLTIVPVDEATIDKCVREINKISKNILEILKL